MGQVASGVNASSALKGLNCTAFTVLTNITNGVMSIKLTAPWNGKFACNISSVLNVLQSSPRIKLLASATTLITVTLSEGVLRVVYLGLNWPLTVLSIVPLIWPIVAQIYSYALKFNYSIPLIWFISIIVRFIIGMIENGVIYVIPIRFSLRPIIGSDSVNVILRIFDPLSLL